jgi:hypothetical protein
MLLYAVGEIPRCMRKQALAAAVRSTALAAPRKVEIAGEEKKVVKPIA